MSYQLPKNSPRMQLTISASPAAASTSGLVGTAVKLSILAEPAGAEEADDSPTRAEDRPFGDRPFHVSVTSRDPASDRLGGRGSYQSLWR